jgi:hypothetical protein
MIRAVCQAQRITTATARANKQTNKQTNKQAYMYLGIYLHREKCVPTRNRILVLLSVSPQPTHYTDGSRSAVILLLL